MRLFILQTTYGVSDPKLLTSEVCSNPAVEEKLMLSKANSVGVVRFTKNAVVLGMPFKKPDRYVAVMLHSLGGYVCINKITPADIIRV